MKVGDEIAFLERKESQENERFPDSLIFGAIEFSMQLCVIPYLTDGFLLRFTSAPVLQFGLDQSYFICSDD